MTKDCIICGKPYEPTAAHQKYCSKACRDKADYARRRTTATCMVCGKKFVAADELTKYCSPKCIGYASPRLRLTDRCGTDMYHSESLDRKAKEWGYRYGEEQSKDTLEAVGKVDVIGILTALGRLP